MNAKASDDIRPSLGLARRALLTNLNALLGYATRLVSAMLISPVVIRTLGVETFGAWSMISQLTGYFALADLRSSGTLKVLIMLEQHREASQEKRRLVGAAVLFWCCSLVLLFLGALLVLPFSEVLIRTGSEYSMAVRWAISITLLDLAVSQLFSIPGNVLRGSNLDYKSLGLRSVLGLVASFLGLIFVKAGWGIPGLALAGLIGSISTGVMWLYLVIHHVDWFGIAIPDRDEVARFVQNSALFFAVTLGQTLFLTTDILLVGFLSGASSAGTYATTGSLIRFVMIPVTTLVASVTAGLIGICGKQDWARVIAIKHELSLILIVMAVPAGTMVLFGNHSFLDRWVGPGFFGGQSLTLALVLLSILQCLYQVESMFVDGVRAFREKSYICLCSGLLAVTGGYLLSTRFGPLGVAFGMLLARLMATIWLAWVVRRKMGTLREKTPGSLLRPLLVGCILLAGASLFAVRMATWPGIIVTLVTSWAVSIAIIFMIGLTAPDRRVLRDRLQSLVPAIT